MVAMPYRSIGLKSTSIDGDTIEIQGERIRILDIDAPETLAAALVGKFAVLSAAPYHLTVTVAGKEQGTLHKEGFPSRVLQIFLGPKPPNEALKNGLLGLD